jgi:hypothetical protein
MKKVQLPFKVFLLSFLISTIIITCSPLIATYDQYSYTQLSSVKVDVSNIVDKASEDYSVHRTEVDNILTEVHKAMEYDVHKPKNEIMAKMWAILNQLLSDTTPLTNSPTSHLKGIIASWKKEKKLSPEFAAQAKNQLSDGFDLLLDLESKKIKSSDTGVQNFLKNK